jgi:hypothetical protein
MKVIDQIAATPTTLKTALDGQQMTDVPATPVVIKSARLQPK